MKKLPALLFSALALGALSCSTAPAAPPAPARPPQEEVIGWEISPAQGYVDRFGYVSLEFTPPGRLTVHLGRQGLDHANTVWYSFAVTEGSLTLLSLSGNEGIPNVKGPDGNWWNDVVLDLPQPVSGEIGVAVEDKKVNVTYAFTLRKLLRHEKD